MQKNRGLRIGLLIAAAAVVAIGVTTVAYATTSSPSKGKTFYFIPKDTLNPYEVIADRGGKIALTQLGNKQVVSSGSRPSRRRSRPERTGSSSPQTIHRPSARRSIKQ
jgi:ABC-type sugar transport system substrate-binding protein